MTDTNTDTDDADRIDGPNDPCPARDGAETHQPSEPIPFKDEELAVVFACVCTECRQILGADGTWF